MSVRMGLRIAGVIALGLAIWLSVADLGRADSLGSVISAVVSVVTLVVSFRGTREQNVSDGQVPPATGPGPEEPERPAPASRSGIARLWGTVINGDNATFGPPATAIALVVIVAILGGVVLGALYLSARSSEPAFGKDEQKAPVSAPAVDVSASSAVPQIGPSAEPGLRPAGPDPGQADSGTGRPGHQATPGQQTPGPPKPTIPVPPISKTAPATPPAGSTVSHFAVTCTAAYYACHEGLTLNAADLDTQSAMAFIGEWRPRDSDDRDDLWVSQTGFLATKGGQIAVVAADSAPSRVKCQKVGAWRSEISFAELREDSQLCMRTGVYGRLAGMVLRSKPAAGRVMIAGYTYF